MWYIVCFILGGTLGFLCAAILCAGKQAERFAEDITKAL